MNEHEHGHPEQTAELDPEIAIYVASLADYNAGRLHGAWINAKQEPEEIHDAIQNMLADSTQPDAEEWAIHDHTGLGHWQPNEHEPIETIAIVAAGITRHGPAFAAWAYDRDDLDIDAEDHFEEAFLGEHATIEEFIDDYLLSIGATVTAEPDSLQRYAHTNTDALARDLEIELDIINTPDGRVWVFDPYL